MSKKSFLDSIEIKSPCSQSWSEMRGDDRMRFCDHCAKDVHNLSRFRRKDARRLLAESGGELCVQYVRRPDGTIDTLKKQLHQITRRTGIAAGVLGTSLGISALAYAQAPATEIPNKSEPEAASVQKNGNLDPLEKSKIGSTISGTITDPNGAVIPFALVTIADEQINFFQTANSNQDGFYEFKDLPDGTYKLKFEAGGFEAKEAAQINVGAGATETQNAQLAVQSVQEQVNVDDVLRLPEIQNVVLGGFISVVSAPRNNLVLAVEENNLSEVKMRISMGGRVNAKDKGHDGDSPLHVAAENGNLEIAEVLLNAGAKINSKNFEKRTPLMMLDEDADAELVNLLLRHGAKINLIDKQGNTALILAATYASREIVQTLISAGANVNAVNKQGETALMRAAEDGDAETVQLLLGSGANAAARSRDGKTALDLTENEEVRQYLIAYGAAQ